MTAHQDSSASNSVDTTTVYPLRSVRFALRKKRNFSDRNKKDGNTVNLSSYNSDFLSGLFADVAKANVLKELSIELPSSALESSSPTETTCPSSMFDGSSFSHIVPDSMNSPRPLKKSRVSFRSSSYRSRASCMNLLARQSQSPKGINEISSVQKNKTKTNQDSLAYQMDCLKHTQDLSTSTRALPIQGIASVSPTNKAKKKLTKDVAALAFPNLPSTVSDSSCESNNVTATGLTRERCLIQHGSAPEITASVNSCGKESFGWFVDLDANEEASVFSLPTKSDKTAACQELAFQAPTAPKQATDHVQEEVEQAYAADTIDSVLGDFF